MKPRVYIAGKMENAEFFRQVRQAHRGLHVTCTWIDAPVIAETHGTPNDFRCHWAVDEAEIKNSDFVLVYAMDGKEVLRGALVEAGMGIAYGKTVIISGDLENSSFGTWRHHPQVVAFENVFDAIAFMCSK